MQTPKKRKVQTVKPVTVSNKPKKKPVPKNPAKGFLDELSTRFKATTIKFRESPAFAPIKGTERKPSDRSVEEQRILDKDQQIIRYKEAAAKAKADAAAKKRAAEKKKVADMQNKGGYKKAGFAKGGTNNSKPKAMYGMSMKPTMMKRGGTKKK